MRVVVQVAFAQRTAVVRADVVEAVELAAHVKQHDQPVVDFDELSSRDRGCR